MSSDNGIYFHKFRDGWRVIHAQAIEDIYWQRGKNKYNYRILKEVFSKSPLFKTRDEATKYAWELYDKIMKSMCPIIEYGISEV